METIIIESRSNSTEVV